jgi:hypothetical protein
MWYAASKASFLFQIVDVLSVEPEELASVIEKLYEIMERCGTGGWGNRRQLGNHLVE